MEIHVTRAAGQYEQLVIVIDQDEFPEPDTSQSGWESVMREFYRGEARRLVDALQNHLPGATLDHLLAELALRKASLLNIPYGMSTTENVK